MDNALTTVEFHGVQLLARAGESPATTMVVMKPVVEGMGLDWKGQHAKLAAHPVLSKGMENISIPSAGGTQHAAAIPLSRLNFWLATIQPNKVPVAIRSLVISYQEECADVLFAHFFAKATESAPAPLGLDDPRALRTLLLGYTEKVIALEERVVALEPKAAALDRIAGMQGSTNITDTAKALRLRPRYLFTWLAEHGWIFRRCEGASWKAYQDKIDAGLLRHVEVPDRGRDDRSFPMCKVTPKGRARLAEIFSQAELAGVRRAA